MASLESYTPCLLGAMDRLWFQRIVLLSEPICSSKIPLTKSSPTSSPESHPSPNPPSAPTDCSDDDVCTEEFSHVVRELLPTTISTTPPQKNDSEREDDRKERHEEEKGEENIRELRPTRPNPIMRKTKASSTPVRRRVKTRIKLERTVSCKTLIELEQEEVKGFMDLGFIFDKDRLTPRMMSVIPGLQRMGGQEAEGDTEENDHGRDEDVEVGGGEGRRKPYLSEAWLIKRPDSPLLRMRMPRVSSASNDMKKHLKLWAKTVGYSVVQNE